MHLDFCASFTQILVYRQVQIVSDGINRLEIVLGLACLLDGSDLPRSFSSASAAISCPIFCSISKSNFFDRINRLDMLSSRHNQQVSLDCKVDLPRSYSYPHLHHPHRSPHTWDKCNPSLLRCPLAQRDRIILVPLEYVDKRNGDKILQVSTPKVSDTRTTASRIRYHPCQPFPSIETN
jgi:hypothetical protein